MALEKIIQTSFGDAKYWKIYDERTIWHDDEKSTDVRVAGYKDKTARDNGSAPYELAPLGFRGTDFPFATDKAEKHLETLYSRVKESAKFKDAKDV